MPRTKSQIEITPQSDVLTLPEAAAYLRMDEKAFLALVKKGAIPGQAVGDSDWRFSKAAILGWLREIPHIRDKYLKFGLPPWLPHALVEFILIEQRILELLQELRCDVTVASKKEVTIPGSRQAIMRHFGVLEDEPNPDAFLSSLYRLREESVEE